MHTIKGLKPPYRMNVGCGRNIMEGWINLDSIPLEGVDIVCDLDAVKTTPIGLPDGTVDYFLLSHVMEHIRDTLGLMEELWRIAVPDAIAVVRVPHGAADDAWEDPTHLRPYYPTSFAYFSQPTFWRADYGYRGDWQPEKIQLQVDRTRCEGLNAQQILAKSMIERNLVKELICEMRCIKPIRPPRQELQRSPAIVINMGE